MTEEVRFSEYRAIGSSAPLRQGDVIEKVSDDATRWDRHLLVITADCDFAHGKNHGRVTCVPLLTKEEYLLEFLIPKMREQAIAKMATALRQIFEQNGAPILTEARLRTWPTEESNDDILAAMSVPDNRRGPAVQLLDGIRLLQSAPDSMAPSVETLVTAQANIPGGKDASKIRIDIGSQIQNTFRQTPGDALFLSSIAERYDEGYFAYLRHLEQVSQDDISTGPTRLPLKYRRISRIEDNFTHAIAQRFALVFMSIGLPDAYEQMRNTHAYRLAEEIS